MGNPQESPRLDDRPQGIRVVSNFRQRTGTGSMSPTSLKPGPFSREAPLASIRRRTDSSQRSFCPSRTKILIFAVVLGAFALGLYVSGLIHLIIDVGQIAKTGSNHSVHAPQASQDEIARAVKLVEDDWRHKYNELLAKLNSKDELHANHEVKKNPQDARDIEKVNAVTSREDDGNQNQHQESSKKKQSEQMLKQSELSGTSGKKEQDDEPDEERKTPIQVFPTLPSSSIWCEGNSIQTRTCKFRNLCYNPEKQRWFVLKTSSSTFENVPVNHQRTGLLEAGTVAGHPWVRFHLDEVSPFNSVVQNLNVRYETDLYFMTKRLHPQNIMHNLHDDTIPLFHWIKHFVGKGDYDFRMPFSLNTHRLLFIDPYESSESTRPFQYLTNHPLRMIEYLESDKSVTTCFRDAIVGSSKLTTWYQYGFEEPQGPLKDKKPNGLHIREVSEWFVRRIGSPLGEDELPEQYIGRSSEWEAEFDKKHPETDERSIDFVETDLIIIMARRRNRLMLNEEDLRMHLEKTFKLQAIFVRNEDHTFEEQIKLMRRARVVLAMHGSILIMGMFCRRGTVMIEMFPYAVPSDNYTPYKTMCQLPGMALIYRAWENKHPNTSITHDDEDAMLGGINHLPADEQEDIRSSNTVPTHLCCTSPYWLYRIYQDTIIHIEEVTNLIKDALKESRAMLRLIRKKNWEELNLLPPAIGIADIACLSGEQRKPGTLWAGWELPWTGAKADKWVVKVIDTERKTEDHYFTEQPAIYLPGFEPGSEISFAVKAVIGDVEQEFGSIAFCIV